MTTSPAKLIRGLFEAHLHVADLERAMKFYRDILGLELGLKETTRQAAFFWLGEQRDTMLGIWERPPWAASIVDSEVRPQHIAFAVAFDDLGAVIQRMKQHRVELKNFFEEVSDEPSVFGWIPAASIYFNDPDGHLLEFIAKLDGTPAPNIGIVSLAEWKQSFH